MEGRVNPTSKVESKILPKCWLVILVCFTLSILIPLNSFAAEQAQSKQPATLKELLALSPAQLENCDIARMNLLCAEGLPGAENLKVNDCLATLDEWAQQIKSETDRNFHHYLEDPSYYYNSTNFYKMLMMAVVLYDDFHIRYNPKWIESPEAMRPDDGFGADSRDILINGLVGDQRMGTCSSMPILYIALARRLGYSVKLVKAKEHLFMRWDSPMEKFGIDATGKGLDEHSDEMYRKWPFPITDKEIKEEDYLKSLSPREELSVFLSIRGQCLTTVRRLAEAIESFKAAYQLAPNWKSSQILLADSHQSIENSILQRQAMNMLVAQRQVVNSYLPPDPIPPDLDPIKQMQLRQLQMQQQAMNPILNP